MGLKMTKIHWVISCDQSPFLAPYIEKNTEARRLATNPVDVARAKAMVIFFFYFLFFFFFFQNNCIFGKSIENTWNYGDYHLINNPHDYDRLAKQPHFKNCHIYDENWGLVEMGKTTVSMSKPR